MIHELIKFKGMPLANTLLNGVDDDVACYDLTVGFDDETKLVQLIDNVSPEQLFPDDYVYDSSQSNTMVTHFKQGATVLKERFNPTTTLEIGSNSGIFIQHFSSSTTVAVEPCSNFASLTNKMGYKTYDEFWGMDLSKNIRDSHGQMDLIFSANAVSHIQNLDECFQSVRHCLSDEGVFIVECPSFLEVLKENAFDQFYHEHQSYFSSISFSNLLQKNGLKLFDLEMHPVHGGSYRYFVCKDTATHAINEKALQQYKTEEQQFGADSYEKLLQRIQVMKHNMAEIKKTLTQLKRDGNVIIGYGASAKFIQVSNMCELDATVIDYVLDTTPFKQNKYTPKSKIKIVPYDSALLAKADYCFLGAWNFRDEIINKEQSFIAQGGKFVTHIPAVEIIE
ncbi:MAG: hypothetical protein COB66_01680 [Coxiella sp. (in: Bacteria)]|nr:MAG: hypothetical protein COB66_01680 [Coxiella sp. (in: g-proteobacteria)]